MITAFELRSHINTILANYIGKYTWNNGSQANAIAILPDNKHGFSYPPPGTTVTGIEAVIIRPVPSTKLLLTGYIERATWEIYLKQWDRSSSLIDATEELIVGLNKLEYAFESPIRVPPNERVNGLESIRTAVYEYSIVQ